MKWDKVKLGDVLIYEQPTRYIVESEDYDDGFSTPVLTAGKTFILGYTDETSGIYTNLPAIIFDDFTTESKFVTFPFKVKSSAMKILTCDPYIADIRYMFYLLKNLKVLTDQHKRYWISKFANIEVPLPPLHIQEQIADTLDKADAFRRKDQELLKKYDELAHAVFYDMFGDPYTNSKGKRLAFFRDVCTVRQGLQIPISERKQQPGENRLPYITIQYLNGGKTAEYIENPRHSVICTDDDVLMTRTGNTGMAISDVKGVFHNNFFLIDFDRKKLFKKYIYFYLKHPAVKSMVLKKASTTTIPDLNHGDFYSLPLILPSMEEQNLFIERLINIENAILASKDGLVNSEKLFNQTLEKCFS